MRRIHFVVVALVSGYSLLAHAQTFEDGAPGAPPDVVLAAVEPMTDTAIAVAAPVELKGDEPLVDFAPEPNNPSHHVQPSVEPNPAPARDQRLDSQIPSQDIPPPVGISSPLQATPGPTPTKSGSALPDFGMLRVYGLVKPTIIYGSGAFESFSDPNMAGITAAANPAMASAPTEGRWTLQVAQSRFGVFVNQGGRYSAQMELDFWDSRRPTPTVASVPRLRIFKASVALSDNVLLEAGQDNDLFAPLNPHTNNLAGNLHEAGNLGLKRQQVKLIFRPEHFELGIAAGFPTNNNGSSTTAPRDGPELDRVPSVAVRLAIVTPGLTLGWSGIATQVEHARDTPQARKAGAYAGAIYFTIDPSDDLDIRVESYLGRNTRDLRLFGLAQGYADQVDAAGNVTHQGKSVDEYGAFISIRQRIVGSAHAVYAMAGLSSVINRDAVLPGYQYNDAGEPSTVEVTLGPGMKHNVAYRVGYEYRPVQSFAWVIEGMYYDSLHVLLPQDSARFDPHRTAFGVESGIQLSF